MESNNRQDMYDHQCSVSLTSRIAFWFFIHCKNLEYKLWFIEITPSLLRNTWYIIMWATVSFKKTLNILRWLYLIFSVSYSYFKCILPSAKGTLRLWPQVMIYSVHHIKMSYHMVTGGRSLKKHDMKRLPQSGEKKIGYLKIPIQDP